MNINDMIEKIKTYKGKPIKIMEVCGTHTMNIAKSGIKHILPKNITIVSGPGCPVCVTEDLFMQYAFQLAQMKNTIIATFGDLLKIPYNNKSLSDLRGLEADVRLVYSTLDCLELAEKNRDKRIIFLSVGFETTTPLSALLIKKAYEKGLDNLFILVGNKVIPPTIELLLEDSNVAIDAFIYPGNVCVITGEEPFRKISYDYNIKGVICGFSDQEIIESIYTLISGNDLFYNCYSKAVTSDGNCYARRLSQEVFDICDTNWRGMGTIKNSGLTLKENYLKHDATRLIDTSSLPEIATNRLCRCGEILKGILNPNECPCFGEICSPLNPLGPCMVSSEGSCAASYLQVLKGELL